MLSVPVLVSGKSTDFTLNFTCAVGDPLHMFLPSASNSSVYLETKKINLYQFPDNL